MTTETRIVEILREHFYADPGDGTLSEMFEMHAKEEIDALIEEIAEALLSEITRTKGKTRFSIRDYLQEIQNERNN
jgi:hypothetical protein